MKRRITVQINPLEEKQLKQAVEKSGMTMSEVMRFGMWISFNTILENKIDVPEIINEAIEVKLAERGL